MDLLTQLGLLMMVIQIHVRVVLTVDDEVDDNDRPSEYDLAKSRKDFLEKNGFTLGELDNIKIKLSELRELRANLTNTDKAWLDSLMPTLRDVDDAFDGCSWMTSSQIDYIVTLVKHKISMSQNGDRTHEEKSGSFDRLGPRRKKRKVENFSTIPVRKWRNPIFYKFDGTHNMKEIGIIRSAFHHWQAQTCLRFFEFHPNAYVFFDHLIVSGSMYGCLSFVGKSDSKVQLINLHGKCLTRFGTPVHEIGHTLGLWHEHQRWDRDKYIRIITNNVANYRSQFWRQRTDTFELPYDYGSIMHYGSKDGSASGGDTIETIDPLYQQSLGQRTGLTFYDAKSINIAYCKHSCRQPLPKACERGGYQDPNACTRCRCPDGFGGLYCETVAPPVGVLPCGGIVYASESGTIITSPGYDFPGFYDDKTQCNWLVKAPKHHRLILRFMDDFGLYCYNRHICHHWVEVKYRNDLSHPGPRFCCFDIPNVALVSDGPELLVILRANHTTYWTQARRGFKVKIRTDKMSTKEIDRILKKTDLSKRKENKLLPGTEWGKWGRCQNSECKCGGCSISTRHSMCGKKKCVGNYARSEAKVCNRRCRKEDTYLNLSGNIIELPCPECCKGFRPKGDICESEN